MKIQSQELIDDLVKRTEMALEQVKHFRNCTLHELNWKAKKDSWSILECMEHLNRYGRFYIPEMKKRIRAGSKYPAKSVYKSGWLGNYFAKSMLPKEDLNKMNTFQSMNPLGSQLDLRTVDELIQQLQDILQLLESARQVDLAKIKTGVTISQWIKLRLGDTFRVVIYHIQRHMVQMENALNLQRVHA